MEEGKRKWERVRDGELNTIDPKNAVISYGVPCPCHVCSPAPEKGKPKRLSEAALKIALANQRPNPAKSVIMPMSRFRDFWGRTNTSKFMGRGGR